MKSYKTVLMSSLLIMGICSITQAQEQTDSTNVVRVISKTEKGGPVVSMTFDEAPLSDVIKAFRNATGANIISSGTNLQQSVSVRLDNVPWQKGLSSILEPQGMQLVEKPAGSGIYLINVRTVEIPKVTKTFQLSNAKVADVEELFAAVLGSEGKATAFPASNTIIVTAPEKELNECEMILNAIDAPTRQVYIEARFVEMSAAASKSLGLKWDTLNEWGATASSMRGGLQNNNSRIATYPTETITTEDSLAGDGTKRDLGVSVIPDKIEGSTMAGTLPNDMTWERVRAYGGMMNLDDFRIALSAFEQADGVTVFSNPKVIVANEEKAKIDMTTKEPNIEVDYQAATTEGQRDSVSTKLAIIPGEEETFVGEAFFSYGITLEVTPRISNSGLITVTIEPSISDKVDDYAVQGLDDSMPVGRFPIIDMRRIQTVFSMQSGKTAVIGGLSMTSNSKEDSGIPFLKDIPWIGPRVFGWKNRQKEQKEIVIFVTVGIADPVTIEEDAGMPRNAVLSRDVMNGKIKEPYQMTRQELFGLSDKKIDMTNDADEPEAEETAVAEEPEEEKTEEKVKDIPEESAEEIVTEKEAAEIEPILAD
ncbi:MAG: secretin N-terminal domain-containing protein [Kiritimatiellia bacterium]